MATIGEGGEGARVGADPQLAALRGDQLLELLAGALQPRGERVGMGQQQRPAGVSSNMPAPRSMSGRRAALEAADVLGDGGLRERQLRGRARERARVRNGAEGEQAARIQHQAT